CATITTIGEDW
nr:immunoglobulin heavy chain junction region [Macaca mulatta]